MKNNQKYTFYRQKEDLKKTIIARKDNSWHQDSAGYFLIRLNLKNKTIEVGFSTNQHIITIKIIGNNATDIYNCIIKRKLVRRLEHAAYLGKELYKAELALKNNKRYLQDYNL